MAEATTPEWLERANRLAMTTTLLATTVHEVNNALQVITGSAEMLTGALSPDVVGRRTDAIGAHARRASALLAELSAFAKDDTRSSVPVDLAQTVQRAVAMRQYAVARLKLESSFDAPGGPRVVIANPRVVLQIVLNLMLNAEQALERAGGGRLAVVVEGDGRQVTVSVEDNGPGVASEALPKLFVPGALACGQRLGIGLAVAKHLAEQCQGTVTYAPREGGGSRFSLVLPAAS